MENLIAYFSMEIAFNEHIPTYSGGLGMLAGDTIRSASDLDLPFLAVSLIHKKGYFKQAIESDGTQTEEYKPWDPKKYLTKLTERVTVEIEDRKVIIGVWKYDVVGINGHIVPIFLLDTDQEENSPWDRSLTDCLYGGDDYYRLCQEIILGIGGVKMLRKLGFNNIKKFHMNEGHSSLLLLELVNEQTTALNKETLSNEEFQTIKNKCVFTTHTPVPAGHDQFPLEMASKALNKKEAFCIADIFCFREKLNLTYFALKMSHYVNGVAMRHGEISKAMFAPYEINAITNGVHLDTWASDEMKLLFDKYIHGWRKYNYSLRYAVTIPKEELWSAHIQSKEKLFREITDKYDPGFSTDTFTICFARRATRYKRTALIFHDINKLNKIADEVGPIQLIFAGKAHPHDYQAKEVIKSIFTYKEKLSKNIKLIYIPNYNMSLAKYLVSGVDLWLNNPEPPLEASGTSGMKAALNGIPSLSILDGWWIEGHIEGVTGWSIGSDRGPNINLEQDNAEDANSLYDKLSQTIMPTYYHNRNKYLEIMQSAIAINASFFNTQRMVNEYMATAYKNVK